MRPKPIGIIGGAGPLAGVCLLERVLCLSRDMYGCCKDADFPKVTLISFPFSDMLSVQGMDAVKVQAELRLCLEDLKRNGSSVLAIACNTLHAFLSQKEDLSCLVHIASVIAAALLPDEQPMVFCTSTSKRFGLHQQFFSCSYPEPKTQNQVDRIIDDILKGCGQEGIFLRLFGLIQEQQSRSIILGCTELSLYADRLAASDKRILDPLDLVARKLVEISFNNNMES